jgi:hypothetical protein
LGLYRSIIAKFDFKLVTDLQYFFQLSYRGPSNGETETYLTRQGIFNKRFIRPISNMANYPGNLIKNWSFYSLALGSNRGLFQLMESGFSTKSWPRIVSQRMSTMDASTTLWGFATLNDRGTYN